MPSYTFECPTCESLLDVTLPIHARNTPIYCPACTMQAMKRIPSVGAVNAFQPYVHNNIAPEPIYIRTRAQERDEHRKRGLIDAR